MGLGSFREWIVLEDSLYIGNNYKVTFLPFLIHNLSLITIRNILETIKMRNHIGGDCYFEIILSILMKLFKKPI